MSEASEQYQLGVSHKAKGNPDAALTAFRRALIADPNHPDANREAAFLLKEKARREPSLKRPAYETFRKATRLNLDDEKLHDAYIVLAQESAQLEELIFEYEKLCHEYPDNANLKRCYKNLAAITIAMVPKPREARKSNPKARKFWFFISFNLLGSGVFSLMTPAIAAKAGLMSDGSEVMVGLAFFGAGIAAFIFARRA